MTWLHALATIGDSPLIVDDVTGVAYACVCGMRGTYAAIKRHIADSFAAPLDAEIAEALAERDEDFGGGHTKGYYLPNEPRKPATPAPIARQADHPALPTIITEVEDPKEPQQSPRSIAEAFQGMLCVAFAAGRAAAETGEPFEVWYQRAVLQ